MKKLRLLLALMMVIFTVSLVGCNSGADSGTDGVDQSLQKIKDKGELVIGLDDNYPPIGFRDEKGELVGCDIDLATAACEAMGVKPVFKPVEWDGVLLNLKNGDIDVIWNGLGITPERQAEIDFSRVYTVVDNILVVKNDSSIKAKADLEGKIVGTQLGSTADLAITSDPINEKLKELRKFGSYAEAFLDLQSGRIDAVVTDSVNGRYLMKKESLSDDLTVLDNTDLISESWGVGLRKGDLALQEELNLVLDELKANGKSAEISKKWYGDETLIK